MSLGILELLLLLFVVLVVVTQLWNTTFRQTVFVAVGSMGLLMMFLLALAGFFWYQMRATAQHVPLPTEVRHVTPQSSARKDPASVTQPSVVEVIASKDAKPADRPAWVDAPAGLNDGRFEQTVSVGPFDTPSQCEYELVSQLRQAVEEYVDGYLGPGAKRSVTLTNPEVLQMASERWVQQVETSVGPMMYHHARLVLDDSARTRFQQAWRGDEIERRLEWLGGGALIVLSGLLGGYVYLKRQPA